ncbi:TaqI-like C-terminal specificity domain-containing protein [Bacteroides caecimuris]|uniref:TaqI-like C-terminal specificity domain-containing protein n=1 Tax=Bacteroides caecimuris TaxID=1796613 RepID=UPI002648CB3D|nr:TaqI-like C-terminal specificity domain-containing protein [Bacteroides caecimuris]
MVIGNPPYITYRGKEKNSISDSELNNLIAIYTHSAEYKVNSYALFTEAGINIANNQGTISYIIPGTILQNDYLKKIREFLICRNQIKEIVSFSNKVFNAVTDSIILRCKKGVVENNTMLFKRVSDLSLVPIEEKEFVTGEWNNSNKLYVIDLKSTSTDSAIFSKMEASGMKVEDYYKIYVGIVAKGIKQFLSNTKDTIYHKKYLQGKHIAPYQIFFKSVYINFIPELLHSNTDQSVYEQKEKILVRKTGNILMASLDSEQYYTDQSLYNLYLKPNKRYSNRVLLAILNSKLLNYYYNKKLITNADVFPYIKGVHLKMFPLPHLSDGVESELSDLVDTIIRYKKQNIETSVICNKIDKLVYQLYGLTDTEIKTIEQSI